jgi:hypothetical protein
MVRIIEEDENKVYLKKYAAEILCELELNK